MILSNRGRTVHYFSRLFAYSLGPPSPRYYVPYGMKFSRLFFDDPPKFDHVKLNSRKSIDTEVYYFFYMNGSPQVAIFYLHFFTMTKSLRRHHLLLDRYHRKNLFARLNATPKICDRQKWNPCENFVSWGILSSFRTAIWPFYMYSARPSGRSYIIYH